MIKSIILVGFWMFFVPIILGLGILKLDKKVVNRVKKFYNNTEPDVMIDIPYTTTTDGRWLKNMLMSSGF